MTQDLSLGRNKCKIGHLQFYFNDAQRFNFQADILELITTALEKFHWETTEIAHFLKVGIFEENFIGKHTVIQKRGEGCSMVTDQNLNIE